VRALGRPQVLVALVDGDVEHVEARWFKANGSVARATLTRPATPGRLPPESLVDLYLED
jgi:hypothetical protein